MRLRSHIILDDIVCHKREELEKTKREVPLTELQLCIGKQPPPISMVAALHRKGIALIAEVKRASPSRGILRTELNPAALAYTYACGGAAAISVLTESRYFMGSLADLTAVRAVLGNTIPVLRKDFIFDEYQIYESRAYGADCLLLIAAILEPAQLAGLLSAAHKLEMTCLVEVHNEKEVETAVASGAWIIGINNRDLHTFHVDLNTTLRLRPLVPEGYIIVSESGIRTGDDVSQLAQCGINAILVGETLVSAQDTTAKMKELLWSG